MQCKPMANPRTTTVDAAATPQGADALKRAAIQLFAQRGIDGVTVREIAQAAGQRNHGAVAYYFGTKEALVRELVVDGARLIDERRNAELDRIEASGGPLTVREVVDVIIYPSLDVVGRGDEDCYLRFTSILNMTHRSLFVSAVGTEWNRGYQRCLVHLRGLMPPMSPAQANQRLVFAGAYIAQVLALRQMTLADRSRAHATWPQERTLRHLAESATALISAPGEALV